jgi:methylated-DNA-protein-cysteine methyltransferase related protein
MLPPITAQVKPRQGGTALAGRWKTRRSARSAPRPTRTDLRPASPGLSSNKWGTLVAVGYQIRYGDIWEVVKRIPVGRVATYGQIAVLAGLPGHARQVGYALHHLPDNSHVPWHRVINASGGISLHSDPAVRSLQRGMLESEGISFCAGDAVDLVRFRWKARPGKWVRFAKR